MTKETIIILAWFALSIVAVIYFKVFASKPLADAPVRRSNFSLLALAAVFLLYIGTAVTTQTLLALFHAPLPLPTTTHVSTATAPAATAASAPATTRSAITTADATSIQLFDTFTKLFPVICIVLLATRLVTGGLHGWGLSIRKIPAGLLYGLLGFIIIYSILMVIGNIDEKAIQYFAHRQEELHPTLELLGRHDNTPWENAVFILSAGIAAPLFEEIFFRGLIQTVFMERAWGSLPLDTTPVQLQLYRPSVSHRWAAITVTSLLFAAIHYMPDAFPVLFVLALALGYLYERTGNLWACIFLHGTFNGINIALYLYGNK